MSDQMQSLFYRLWEAACQDAPIRPSAKIEDGNFVLTISGNRSNWANLVQRAGVPATAKQTEDGDTLTVRWASHADAIFGADGMIAQRLSNYEMRLPQLHMGRMVQRAIEMESPAVVEAGTGVGKSLGYAAVCLAMGKRCIISTSNKNLQMQLWKKDLPFLQGIFPGKKVALAVGKGNFACRAKCERDGNITIDNADLRQWYSETPTGNTEEITFAVDYKALKGITVDEECTGKHCPFYYNCFYYLNRDAMKNADVIICNHALLCIDQVAGGNVLPPVDVTVIDEAHKLVDYARNALGAEFTFNAIEKAIGLAEGFSDNCGDVDLLRAKFEAEISAYLRGKDEPQVGINRDAEFTHAKTLAEALLGIADDVWPEDEGPADAEETRLYKRSRRIRTTAAKVTAIATPNEFVRWIEQARRDDPLKLCAQPSDVSAFVGRIAGVYTEQHTAEHPDYTRCTRCSRQLTAKTVALLDGKPYGPDCIQHVDPYGDAETVSLHEWLAAEHAAPDAAKTEQAITYRATIFTSATLAAPDMTHFLHTCGLPDAIQMQAKSPFDYENNALLYVPNGTAPAPSAPEWMLWMFDQVRRLVLAADGGAFLLFTSYNAMTQALQELRYTFTTKGMTVLVQGEMPKLEIAKRFKAEKRAVLFATKSFWEGVDIQGDALRLVVVDKLPFEAPSPLTAAMEADVTDAARAAGLTGKPLEMAPFNQLRVPRMIIDLKQGAGRLIRTATDKGVIAILDSRIRATQYGRNAVLPALPDAPVTSRIEAAEAFLQSLVPVEPVTLRNPVPSTVYAPYTPPPPQAPDWIDWRVQG